VLVLVVVIAVRGVPVAAMGVINVVTVPDGLVTAAGPVNVVVSGMGQVWQRVLVIMPRMRRVGVAIVDIVGVALALSARVSAAHAVNMLRVNVLVVISRCHGSSFLYI
jgi:hypothetical protein